MLTRATSTRVTTSVASTLGAVVGVFALATLLTGCVSPDPVPVTGSTHETATDRPATIPTESTQASITGVPTNTSCARVLSADALYSLKGGANYTLIGDITPAPGTTAAKLVDLRGLSCTYVNDTNATSFTVAVARITPETMPLAKEQVDARLGQSARASIYETSAGCVGYFATGNTVGEAQVLTDTFWVDVSSDTFETPQDAAQIVASVLKGLGE